MNESTLVPREEMSDLDWLARNVHEWDKFGETLISKVGDQVVWSLPSSPPDADTFTKAEWLARRAELQNKPRWEDAPGWATHLGQNKRGQWYFMQDGQVVDNAHIYHMHKKCSGEICVGEVLGDWRDTLEKRPADMSEQAVTARLKDATDNVLAAVPELMTDKYKFTPFTSIEDNQEKDMKQDNGWFERGELPPVGFECEMKRIDGRWCKAVTVGKDSGGRMVCELNDNGVFYASTSSAESFRPIRTERDELLSIIVEEMNHYDTDGKLADAILAAGFSLRDK